jgi:hypothetical protein
LNGGGTFIVVTEDRPTLQRFAEEVIPALRSAAADERGTPVSLRYELTAALPALPPIVSFGQCSGASLALLLQGRPCAGFAESKGWPQSAGSLHAQPRKLASRHDVSASAFHRPLPACADRANSQVWSG